MRFLVFFLLSFSIVFFTACGSKRVYEPKTVEDSWDYYGDIDDDIIDITSNVALLDNQKVLTKSGVIDIEIPENYRLLDSNDGWVISSSIDGKVNIQSVDKSSQREYDLKKTIAAASIKGDVLAVLFTDNEMALYSVSRKELLLRFQGDETVVVDSRIINPYFLNDLVLFSTLDGKVVIINEPQKKKLRTVIVSSEDNFNNIIYFNVIDNKVVAATAYKILSMSQKEVREKYEIRNVAYNGTSIFLTTKQGELVSLNPDLQLNAKLKFPFAHFLGLIVTDDKVYALEKEGYIIEAPTDLSSYTVYDVDFDEGYVFVGDKKFYVDDGYISIEK